LRESDVYRSGGEQVVSMLNTTTDSAVRITHIPTGVVVALSGKNVRSTKIKPAAKTLAPRISANMLASSNEVSKLNPQKNK